jgi:hypothetical protein
MSRYELNKFMMYVDETTELVHEFCGDKEGFVERWVNTASASPRPLPHAGNLTKAEQQALINVDVSTLYQMGTHPYILLHFARAVAVEYEGIAFPEFDRAYKEQVAPHGYPDFST